MTMNELIAHFSKNLVKVIESHGAESHYTTFAFFQLQAVKMGMNVEQSNAWAQAESDRLHKATLDAL